MTTTNDDLNDLISLFGKGITEIGLDKDLFANPIASVEYLFSSSVNKASYGAKTNQLVLGGGIDQVGFSIGPVNPSMNTRNRVIGTASGHSFELDDTPGNERILIKHNTGSGIQISADGSMIISSSRQIISVSKDQKIVIEGDATIVYGSNVNMKVKGNFNLDVEGDYNVSVGSNKTESIEGSMRTTVDKNVGLTIKGNKSETILKASISTILGNNTTITKGVMRNTSQGNMQLSSGANTQISARDKFFASATNMNIAATDLTIMGQNGAIGGENMLTYGKSASYSEGVTAPTFHGDLDGKASTAALADKATGADTAGALGSAGTAGSITNTPTDLYRTLPTASLISDYLFKTAVGAIKVEVDIGDFFFKSINKSSSNGGLSDKDLTVEEVRAIMRDPGNVENQAFIGNAIATGKLSPKYTNTTPPAMGRVSGKGSDVTRGTTPLGWSTPGTAGKFKATQNNSAKFLPSVTILDTATVDRSTFLTDSLGVMIGSFMGKGRVGGNILDISVPLRPQIARNLQPQAELLVKFRKYTNENFKNLRLIPVEGLYIPTPNEKKSATWADSINKLKSEGRAVVWELQSETSEVPYEKTFDVAVYLKNIYLFEKLIIDYDNFDPSGNLNAQIILIMPKLNESYEVVEGNFFRAVETRYNGKVTSNSDLVEVKTEEQAAPTPPPAPAPLTTKEPFVSKYDKYKFPIWTYNTQDKYFDDYIDQTGPFAKPGISKDGTAKYVFYRANWDGGNIRIHVSERATLADQYGPETYGWSPSMTISGYEKRYNAKVSQQLKDLDNIVRVE
jgi:hypothetical protein